MIFLQKIHLVQKHILFYYLSYNISVKKLYFRVDTIIKKITTIKMIINTNNIGNNNYN